MERIGDINFDFLLHLRHFRLSGKPRESQSESLNLETWDTLKGDFRKRGSFEMRELLERDSGLRMEIQLPIGNTFANFLGNSIVFKVPELIS